MHPPRRSGVPEIAEDLGQARDVGGPRSAGRSVQIQKPAGAHGRHQQRGAKAFDRWLQSSIARCEPERVTVHIGFHAAAAATLNETRLGQVDGARLDGG